MHEVISPIFVHGPLLSEEETRDLRVRYVKNVIIAMLSVGRMRG